MIYFTIYFLTFLPNQWLEFNQNKFDEWKLASLRNSRLKWASFSCCVNCLNKRFEEGKSSRFWRRLEAKSFRRCIFLNFQTTPSESADTEPTNLRLTFVQKQMQPSDYFHKQLINQMNWQKHQERWQMKEIQVDFAKVAHFSGEKSVERR